jgi:hypothetical protein
MSDFQFNVNTKFKNFVDIPVRSLIFLLKKFRLYDLFEEHVRDPRVKKSTYSIASLLMVAFEMLIFRSPSKNRFYQKDKLGRKEAYHQLAFLAGIKEERFPSSKTLDDLFWLIDPKDLEPVPFEIFKKLRINKLFTNHTALKKTKSYNILIDAFVSHTYYPHSQHPCEACPYCLKRERPSKKGEEAKIWYVHMDVVANLVFEGGFQLPLCFHRIRKRKEWDSLSTDDLKQECEMTALPVILKKIRTYLPKQNLTIFLDGIQCNQTAFDTLNIFNCEFCIVLKRLASVKEDFHGLSPEKKTRTIASRRFFLTQSVAFANELSYRKHTLNVLEFHEHAQKKPTKRFAKVHEKNVHYQWILSEKITEATAFNRAFDGRARWFQEDFFNTLKKRGYFIQHDYTRHPKSQIIWMMLTFLAFIFTSLLEISDLGILARKGATMRALMEEMLQDLSYLSHEDIFLSSYPTQLRFSLWPNAG